MLSKLRTYQLALNFHKQCQKLRLKGELGDQMNRASISIILNIAEGSAKNSMKDRARFYRISLGSLRETQAILDIIENNTLKAEADYLGAHLFKLCQSCH